MDKLKFRDVLTLPKSMPYGHFPPSTDPRGQEPSGTPSAPWAPRRLEKGQTPHNLATSVRGLGRWHVM